MIGMSPGNAHPYSWSSIINGHFDGEEITKVGYPGVTDYLMANQDTLGLPNARVTHLWTQDKSISAGIAKSAKIDTVVDRIEDLTTEVDAIILARDDAHNHVAMSRPFLEAGIPIFIDKPLALSREDLGWYNRQQKMGRFFMSCSSMRYAHECRTAKTELKALGKIELITAVGKKDWPKYGVHLLEAIFSILDDPEPVSVQHIGKKDRDIVHVVFEDGIEAMLHLFMNISSTFQISIFGQEGWRLVEIRNSYSMFQSNILEFIKSLEVGSPSISFSVTEKIMLVIIAAGESLDRGGEIIKL